MKERIIVSKENHVWLRIKSDSLSIDQELSEYFKFQVPGYRFMPLYKARRWDGHARLFNSRTKQLYIGLFPYLQKFCTEREYELVFDTNEFSDNKIIEEDFQEFISELKMPFELRDYQIEGIRHAIKKERCTIISPTASGKSAIIYALTQWYKKEKVLLIVPTLGLISQMESDFNTYSNGKTKDQIHSIFSGQEKNTDKRIVVSTWQSLMRMEQDYFNQYGVIIVDEIHGAKSDALKGILERCVNTRYRIGTTGTLQGDDAKCHKLVIEGLTGLGHKVISTKELMDLSHISTLEIDCVIMKYDEVECKAIKGSSYQDEMNYIISHPKRNIFIRNLALAQKSNTMVLFQFVEKHGEILYQMIKEKAVKDRKVFFIAGSVDKDDREKIRQITENEKNAIIVAGVQVFATGTNIKNLDVLIFAAPSKSRIRSLQSIGRILRIGTSDKAKAYDLIDDLSYKSHKNFILKHFIERLKIYAAEKFSYKIFNINLPTK